MQPYAILMHKKNLHTHIYINMQPFQAKSESRS